MAMSFSVLTGSKTTAGSIKSSVNYSKIESEVVLEEAQSLLYSTLRVREMKTLWQPAVIVGDYYKALPTGFLDPIGKLRDNFFYTYTQRTEDRLLASRLYDEDGNIQSGQPAFWAIFDERVNFDIKFDTAKTLSMLYFKSPTVLSGSNETNFVTVRYPHLLRQACIVRAHAFMKSWTAYNAELALLGPMIERANVEADLTYVGADYDQDLP